MLKGEPKLLTVAPLVVGSPRRCPLMKRRPWRSSPPSFRRPIFSCAWSEEKKPWSRGITLKTAPVVIGGGRGVGSPEGYGVLEELAALLGGAVGGSRIATNNGWRPHSDQIGLTGSRIAPDLYIACGISGAIQHLVGCKGAKRILVINNDPEAPFFSKSRLRRGRGPPRGPAGHHRGDQEGLITTGGPVSAPPCAPHTPQFPVFPVAGMCYGTGQHCRSPISSLHRDIRRTARGHDPDRLSGQGGRPSPGGRENGRKEPGHRRNRPSPGGRTPGDIVAANRLDLERAAREDLAAPLLKRLRFDEAKIAETCLGLRSLEGLADPVGKTLRAMELDEGLELFQVTCPIGVIGVIFESRPDALVQISSLCLKSGNSVLLKGGSEAAETNRILAGLIAEASLEAGIPEGWLGILETRENVAEMLGLDEAIDLIVPRGSNAFVRHIMENTNIPVLGHADGICHVYVDREADLDQAVRIASGQQVPVRGRVQRSRDPAGARGPWPGEFLPVVRMVPRGTGRGDPRVRADPKGDRCGARLGGGTGGPSTWT